MTPTERERIDNEERISRLAKESIERDAQNYRDEMSVVTDAHIGYYKGYIAGAEAQYKKYLDAASVMLPQIFHEQLKNEKDKARNQAIDACKQILKNQTLHHGRIVTMNDIINQMEDLKNETI